MHKVIHFNSILDVLFSFFLKLTFLRYIQTLREIRRFDIMHTQTDVNFMTQLSYFLSRFSQCALKDGILPACFIRRMCSSVICSNGQAFKMADL